MDTTTDTIGGTIRLRANSTHGGWHHVSVGTIDHTTRGYKATGVAPAYYPGRTCVVPDIGTFSTHREATAALVTYYLSVNPTVTPWVDPISALGEWRMAG